MEVKASVEEVLREAVRDLHPNETFEKSLGRAIRKHGGTYEDYLDLIRRVRRRAEKDKGSLKDAAKALSSRE